MTDTHCTDCRIQCMPDSPQDVRDWHRYMVHNDLWAQAGMTPNGGWLCVGCLELRLGRPLTGADFKDVQLNDPKWHGNREDTPRIAALKREAAALKLEARFGRQLTLDWSTA